MADQTKLAIKLMYFGNNYPHDFIDQVWDMNKHLAEHLKIKFGAMYSNYGTMTFFRWFMELSDGNKTMLINWISENYRY